MSGESGFTETLGIFFPVNAKGHRNRWPFFMPVSQLQQSKPVTVPRLATASSGFADYQKKHRFILRIIYSNHEWYFQWRSLAIQRFLGVDILNRLISYSADGANLCWQFQVFQGLRNLIETVIYRLSA
jgi:hypothetical protein